ncbi:MAG: hypothetical protein EBY96_06795, partial [Actinobacteria bacterium]|nr:hypothetical protein [Actinomycetota bacterium]
MNSTDRLTTPLVKNAQGVLEPTSWANAMDVAGRMLRAALASSPDRVAILGGARLANEDVRAWAMLADAMGISMRDPQIDDGLPTEILELPQASIDDAASASTIVLLAPDLKEELPVLHLRLRDAATKRGVKIIEIAPKASGLTRHAWKFVPYEPGNQVAAVKAALA